MTEAKYYKFDNKASNCIQCKYGKKRTWVPFYNPADYYLSRFAYDYYCTKYQQYCNEVKKCKLKEE